MRITFCETDIKELIKDFIKKSEFVPFTEDNGDFCVEMIEDQMGNHDFCVDVYLPETGDKP